MARIIQVLDVNSDGYRVRLDNGWTALVPHSQGDVQVGAEYPVLEPTATATGPVALRDPIMEALGISRPPSIEFLNSDAQVAANILSEIVDPHPEDVDEALDRLEALEDGDASG